jgi:glycosyltransferase involved in cell wall biosynthesis
MTYAGLVPSCEREGTGAPTRVEAIIEPYNRTQDRYQAYYRQGLAEYCAGHGIAFDQKGYRFPDQLRFLARVRASDKFRKILPDPLGVGFIDGLARLLGARRGKYHCLGSYIFHSGSTSVKVAVDAFDSGEIQGWPQLEWADIYFKTNYWPSLSYPPKVVPLANLNPDVLPRREYLTAARGAEKEWDLFGFFRVWGGTDAVEGVEHNLALFEALARVKCRKKLLAFLVSGDTAAAAARLEKAGVPYTTKWVPQAEVWRMASRSRLNIVRHGMHQCIPWRMTETLAMGGCPVLDYAATTRWHMPLEEDVHYLNLGVPYRPSMAPQADPAEVAERVEKWLADKNLIDDIQRNTAQYFDDNLAPEKLGSYMVETARLGVRVGSATPTT